MASLQHTWSRCLCHRSNGASYTRSTRTGAGSPLSGSGLEPHSFSATYGELMPPSYGDSVMYESAAIGGPSAPSSAMHTDPLAAGSSGVGGGVSGDTARAGPSNGNGSISGGGGGGIAAHEGHSGNGGSCGGVSQGGVSCSRLLRRPSQRASPLSVSVTDPVKREQAGLFGFSNGYVAYMVTSKVRRVGSGHSSGYVACMVTSKVCVCVCVGSGHSNS